MQNRDQKLAQRPEVVDDIMVQLSRNKSPAELNLLASRLFAANRERLKSYLRAQHPEWSQDRVHRELLERIHGTV